MSADGRNERETAADAAQLETTLRRRKCKRDTKTHLRDQLNLSDTRVSAAIQYLVERALVEVIVIRRRRGKEDRLVEAVELVDGRLPFVTR
jgi:hypothetical protein